VHSTVVPAGFPAPNRSLRRLGSEYAMADDSLTVTDNRTGETYTVPIVEGAIRATDLQGLLSYDPAFLNTAACRSAITFIDGDAGILRYRGYPIEEVAEQAGFLEIAYLLLEGELPSADELAAWEDEVRYHTYVHESVTKFLEGFRYDAHPMGMLLGTIGALSTFYPDAKDISDPANRRLQRVRLIAKMPTIAAYVFRHSHGLPYVLPRNDMDYVSNYVNMTFQIGGNFKQSPVLERALETLLILHADHEQNCSTNAVRGVGSSHVDPFSAVSAGIAALYGPLHGGANEAVLKMLDQIGDRKNIPAFIEGVKAGHGRLMGFGHRVYKSYDPRATLIKQAADAVFAETGLNPKLEIALELEKIALEDDYFISRKLYPNVDFYSGLIYQAMGYPVEYFTVLFAMGRLPGWIAQWEEMLMDPEQKIARPRQIYIGEDVRHFVPIDQR
jgi:citrate synthase